jgi:hypothetical protein|tara:strand:- start:304 stop:528 length:225 start_codon:yes stop_codon:yes gene_type:complete
MRMFYILVSLLLVGCTYSQSPSVSPLNEDGKFLGVVNVVTTLGGLLISSHNSIVECEKKGPCIRLKVLVDGEEN